MNNKKIWILGAGKFGMLAFETISQQYPNTAITIVDQNPGKLNFEGVETICEDGIYWLSKHLAPEQKDVDIIIPSIPVHVAAEWLKLRFSKENRSYKPAILPDTFCRSLPNPYEISPNQIHTSFADFICPSSCSEPDGYCSHTGEKRETPLFQLIENSCPPDFNAIVMQSHQLFPGIGGLSPEDFRLLYKRALQASQNKLIVGTACHCHGIADGIMLI